MRGIGRRTTLGPAGPAPPERQLPAVEVRRPWPRLLSLVLTLAVAVGASVLALLLWSPAPDAGPAASPGPTSPGTARGAQPAACTRQWGPVSDLGPLLATLRPGDIVCLGPGTYGARGTRTDWRAAGTSAEPIVLRATTGEPVLLRGFLNIEADHVELDGVVLDGPTGAVSPANAPGGQEVLAWIQGTGVVLRHCEVRGGLWRAGVYVTGRETLIDACWVHDNGPWSDPDQVQVGGLASNIDHGIYWGKGSAGAVINSVLEHNLAYGIQVSGGAGPVLMANDTIVRNGAGGVIWAERTSGSTLVNSIVADNDGYSVNAHLLEGERNVARNNLAWGNRRGNWDDDGPLITRQNGVADPLFRGPGDYRLRAGSPAVDAGAQQDAPPTDYDGRPRPAGAGPDLGAYELAAPAGPSP